MSSGGDTGAEDPKRKRGDSGGERDHIRQQADVIRKREDYSQDIKLLATRLFEHAHIEDSDISSLKLSLDCLNLAIKREQDAEAFRAESRRKKFLLEAGDWFSGVINGLKRFKIQVRTETQKELREALKAEGKTDNEAAKRVTKSDNWLACGGRDTIDMTSSLKAEMAEVRDFRGRGCPSDQAPETPFLDRFQRLCDKAGIRFDNFCKFAELYEERNKVAHTGRPRLDHYRVEREDSDGNLQKCIDWDAILDEVEKRVVHFEKMWKAGDIDEELFHIAERSMRDWFKMHVVPVANIGEHIVWKQTDCTVKELDELDDHAKKKHKKKIGEGGRSPPPSPYKKGKWDNILPE